MNNYYLLTQHGAIPLDKTINTIGRSRCYIKLRSIHASRRHGTIVKLPNGNWCIKNQSTRNYILVNNKLVSPGETSNIVPNDIISFGVETFKFYQGNITINLDSDSSLSPD